MSIEYFNSDDVLGRAEKLVKSSRNIERTYISRTVAEIEKLGYDFFEKMDKVLKKLESEESVDEYKQMTVEELDDEHYAFKQLVLSPLEKSYAEEFRKAGLNSLCPDIADSQRLQQKIETKRNFGESIPIIYVTENNRQYDLDRTLADAYKHESLIIWVRREKLPNATRKDWKEHFDK